MLWPDRAGSCSRTLLVKKHEARDPAEKDKQWQCSAEAYKLYDAVSLSNVSMSPGECPANSVCDPFGHLHHRGTASEELLKLWASGETRQFKRPCKTVGTL